MHTTKTHELASTLFFAVIGRKEGDVEDSLHLVESTSTELAIARFNDAISPNRHLTGVQTVIRAVLCSETPITGSDLDFQAMSQLQDPKLLETLIRAAEQQGKNSDPARQIEALKGSARAMWKLLTPSQKVSLLRMGEVANILDRATEISMPESLSEVSEAEVRETLKTFGLDPSAPYSLRTKLDAVNHYRVLPEARPRYAYCEGWGHIFSGSAETVTRWACDVQTEAVISAQYRDSFGWKPMDDSMARDLLESIKDNEALDRLIAEEFDVDFAQEMEDLPEWAVATEQPTRQDRAGE